MKLKTCIQILAGSASLFCLAATANAQATRTWVSGVGDDANPCSRTAPCKTFAGAISKTAAFGEINALDSGGFGALTSSPIISAALTPGALPNVGSLTNDEIASNSSFSVQANGAGTIVGVQTSVLNDSPTAINKLNGGQVISVGPSNLVSGAGTFNTAIPFQ